MTPTMPQKHIIAIFIRRDKELQASRIVVGMASTARVIRQRALSVNSNIYKL